MPERKIVFVEGLPGPRVNEFHKAIARRYGARGKAVAVVHSPNYGPNATALGEIERFQNVVGPDFDNEIELGFVGTSAGAAIVANALSSFSQTEYGPRLVAVSSRLVTLNIEGYRTMEQLREKSKVAAAAVELLEGVPVVVRSRVTSLAVAEGDELVHPHMTVWEGANNATLPVTANGHGDGIGLILNLRHVDVEEGLWSSGRAA